jgi:hypothetical protein
LPGERDLATEDAFKRAFTDEKSENIDYNKTSKNENGDVRIRTPTSGGTPVIGSTEWQILLSQPAKQSAVGNISPPEAVDLPPAAAAAADDTTQPDLPPSSASSILMK